MSYSLKFIEVDSEVFGKKVWAIEDISSADDFGIAISNLDQDKPYFVSCKLPIDSIELIQAAEKAGFRYVETQFRTALRLKREFDTSSYPYRYVKLESRKDLHEILEIVSTTIEHDRFSRESMIGKSLSGARYKRYIEQSFDREDEEIWCVQSKSSNRLLTFRSHRVVSDSEVLLLLGGVHHEFKQLGLGIISSHFCFNQLKHEGFSIARSHISAANSPIINLELGHFGFRVTDTFVILHAGND